MLCLGLSPFATGSLFVPYSIGFTAASMAAPRLVERFGTSVISWGAVNDLSYHSNCAKQQESFEMERR